MTFGTTPSFGERVRRLRVARGLSQRDLAIRAGLSIGTVRDVEQGRTLRPRPATARALAQGLGVRFDQISGGVGSEAVSSWDIRVLGPLSVYVDGRPMKGVGSRLSAILARLAVEPNEFVHREELAVTLWPGRQPSGWIGLVQCYVAKLRRRFASAAPVDDSTEPIPMIESDRQRYRLRIADDQIDLLRFRAALIAATRAPDPDQELELSLASLAEWRGDTASDVDDLHDHPIVVRINGEYQRAVLAAGNRALAAGRADDAVRLVGEAWQRAPLDEGVAATYIRLLTAAGQASRATETYLATRRSLVREIGLEPCEQLRAAYREALDTGHGSAQPPTIPAPEQLPRAISDFVGRQSLISEFERTLHPLGTDRAPIVAIVGPGGSGKTTLAVELAHRLRTAFPDGQLFVDLRGGEPDGADPGDVLRGFLTALGHDRSELPGPDELPTLYRSTLAGRRCLIVLDNALDVAQLESLTPGTGRSGVIVTSRHDLELPGVRAVQLPPLSPGESRQLLDKIGFPGPVPPDLVDRCAGTPLALRLAAASVRAERRPATTARPHWFLPAPTRFALTRVADQPVQAALEATYHRLDDSARVALHRLVRAPGESLARTLAEAVLSDLDAAQVISELVDAQLVSQDDSDRYRFHDLVRTFVLQQPQIGADEQRRTAHRVVEWFYEHATLATQSAFPYKVTVPGRPPTADGVSPPNWTPDQAHAWFTAETTGLLEAIELASRWDRPGLVWRLVDAASGAFRLGYEATRWPQIAARGLAAAGASAELDGVVLMHEALARATASCADHASAASQYELALQLCHLIGWTAAEISLRENLGISRWTLGESATAIEQFQRALELSRAIGDEYWQAACLNDLGNAYLATGDLAAARQHYETALTMNESIDAHEGIFANRANLTVVLRLSGDYPAAVSITQALLKQVCSMRHRIEIRLEYARLLLATDEAEAALGLASELVFLSEQSLDRELLCWSLIVEGQARSRIGSSPDAEQVLVRGLDLAELINVPAAMLEANLALGELGSGDGPTERSALAWKKAEALAEHLGDRIARARAALGLARLALSQGEITAARSEIARARSLSAEAGYRRGAAEAAALADRANRASRASASG